MKTNRKLAAIVAALALTSTFGQAIAGVGNDVPSCYAANKIEQTQPALEREIFVLIDQTTVLDPALTNLVLENVWGFLQPNSGFTVARFSAFSQGHYTEVVTSGILEAPIADKARDGIGVRQLKKFDECMAGQLGWGRKRATDAAKASMAGATTELAKSDILSALSEISQRVRESKARHKVVFLVSDMLENSSVSSFYASSSQVRRIDPGKELAAAEKAHLIPDFGGARVHVLGAGLLGPAANVKSYRDTLTMSALRTFWTAYFKKTAADLAQFGEPSLIKPVQ